MSLIDWLKPKPATVVVIREATIDGTSDSAEDMTGWSKLGCSGVRELSDRDLAACRDHSALKYISNPYARRAIEHMIGYVVGPGFQVRSWHEGFNSILQEHWEDPDNNWDLRQFELVKDLSIFGEIFPRAFVADKSGAVKWGFIDPGAVVKVVPVKNNAEMIDHILVRQDKTEANPKKLNAIKQDEKKEGEPLKGDVYAFVTNKVRGQTRGVGDLASVLDWLDLSDDFAFTASERASAQQHVVWDLVIPGITQAEAEKLMVDLEPPERGSVQVTSDKDAGWQPKVPDVKGADLKALDDLILRRLEAGTGFPRHWFGEGTDVNRAVGAVMGAPVFRMIMRRQRFVKYIMERMFDFVLSNAIEAGLVKPEEIDPRTNELREVDFEVVCPEITFEDQNPRTAALNQLIMALSLARADGALSDEQYQTILLHQLDKDGYDLPEEIPDADLVDEEEVVKPDFVLNGAQIIAALSIVQAVANGELPRDSGIGQLVNLFSLTAAQAISIMGSSGLPVATQANPRSAGAAMPDGEVVGQTPTVDSWRTI